MNVLIVDDEPFQRKALCGLAVWQQEGCATVRDAANGEDALRILADFRADLVITDIRMPSMDGIELARRVRTHFPTTRVVVLSAYGEFHLVKDSFQTGVYDYFLKAEVDEGQVRDLIRRIRSESLATADMELQSRGYLPYETLIRQLQADPVGMMASMGVGPSHNRFAAFGYKLTTSSDAVMTAIGKRLRASYASLPVRLDPFKIVAIMAVPDDLDYSAIEGYVEHLLMEYDLAELLEAPFDWSAAIDSFFSDLTEIPGHVSTVNVRLEQTFFGDWKRLYRTSTTESDAKPVLDELKAKRGIFLDLLYHKSFNREGIGRLQVMIEPRFATVTAADHIQNYFRWIGSQIQDFALEDNLTLDEELPRLLKALNDAVGRGDTLATLNDLQFGLVTRLGSLCGIRHDLVSRAREYIRSELPRDCAVSDIASALGISSEHLSRTFKAQEQMSLRSYITEERVRFASKLMANSNMKIYEIAEASGFASVEHFSRTFKKVMGRSPKQYRTR